MEKPKVDIFGPIELIVSILGVVLTVVAQENQGKIAFSAVVLLSIIFFSRIAISIYGKIQYYNYIEHRLETLELEIRSLTITNQELSSMHRAKNRFIDALKFQFHKYDMLVSNVIVRSNNIRIDDVNSAENTKNIVSELGESKLLSVLEFNFLNEGEEKFK